MSASNGRRSAVTSAAARGMDHEQHATLPFTMAVNISAKQFAQADLVTQVGHILSETGFTPDNLRLELTESVTVRDEERTIRILSELRKLGVCLCIDHVERRLRCTPISDRHLGHLRKSDLRLQTGEYIVAVPHQKSLRSSIAGAQLDPAGSGSVATNAQSKLE